MAGAAEVEEKMSIEEILDEMEGMLLESRNIPLTNKRMVEEDYLMRLIEEMRDNLPGEIMEANRVMNERQRILEEAQREAQNIVDQAKNYIARLTDENVITRQAQEQAEEIIQQARKSARDLQNDAITYADSVFKHLESNLEKMTEVIRHAHGELHQARRSAE